MASGTKRGNGLNPGGDLEIPGVLTGWYAMDGSTVIGQLEIDSGDMHFKWSSTGAAWPSSFTLEKPNGQSAPSLPVDHNYEHQTFGGSTSHDVSGCDYEIVNDGNVIGWLEVNSGDTVWYGVPAYVSGGYFVITGDKISFDPNTETGSKTAHKVVDDLQ